MIEDPLELGLEAYLRKPITLCASSPLSPADVRALRELGILFLGVSLGWLLISSATRAWHPMTLAVPVLLGGVGVGIVGWSAWRLRAVVRLLLVEEDPLIRGLLELLLARHGYEVATAGDGSAGIRMAREVRPALVVSGVNLPATGEVGLLAAIRAEPGLEQTPVLFLSGDMSPDSVASATELGAVGYLTKPVVAEELLATIQGLLKAPSDASR